jgi:predicted TPR repeat methyltransferase
VSVEVRFARGPEVEQDEEWCEALVDGAVRRFRFHDYAAIFAVPGLYERIFHDLLECTSPRVLAELLAEVVREPVRVLDLGAGNGIVGEELRAHVPVAALHAVDLLPEAAAAAARDRPGVYDSYTVADLTAQTLPLEVDALVVCAALGFGDIPPEVFSAASALVRRPGLVGYTIKEEFLGAADRSGFAALLADLESRGELVPLRERRYVHRLTMQGDPLHYVARVCRAQTGQVSSR